MNSRRCMQSIPDLILEGVDHPSCSMRKQSPAAMRWIVMCFTHNGQAWPVGFVAAAQGGLWPPGDAPRCPRHVRYRRHGGRAQAIEITAGPGINPGDLCREKLRLDRAQIRDQRVRIVTREPESRHVRVA